MRECTIHHITTLDDLPQLQYDLLITSKEESRYPQVASLALSAHVNDDVIRLRILQGLYAPVARFCVIGIDPGKGNIGLAIFLDDHLLSTYVFRSVESLLQFVKQVVLALEYHAIQIKIGDGYKGYHQLCSLFHKLLTTLGTEYQISSIDERHTSVKHQNHLSKHENAALAIAKRIGPDC